MDDLRCFQLEEYKNLRKEIEIYITESRTQERYAVLAVAAIWTWLIANHKTSGALWLVPLLPTALIAFRAVAMQRHFSDLKGYIKDLEDAFGTAGWEHRERKWNVGVANIVLTLVLLTAALVAWYYRSALVK